MTNSNLIFRYYLEPASPLKSINTPSQQQSQPQPLTNGFASKSSQQSVDNSLAVLKSIQLTPPTAANRHHHSRVPHQQNGFAADTNNNGNFFTQQNLNGTSPQNGSIKSDNSSDFVADFSKVSIYNSNNSLNSAGSGGGKTTTINGGDMNANFADFDNNKIYNAAGEDLRSFSSSESWKNSFNFSVSLSFSFSPPNFNFYWHDNVLKKIIFSSFFRPFFLNCIQRNITRTITITQWPTAMSNGTFGNNSNGPINPNRTVGVSRISVVFCLR